LISSPLVFIEFISIVGECLLLQEDLVLELTVAFHILPFDNDMNGQAMRFKNNQASDRLSFFWWSLFVVGALYVAHPPLLPFRGIAVVTAFSAQSARGVTVSATTSKLRPIVASRRRIISTTVPVVVSSVGHDVAVCARRRPPLDDDEVSMAAAIVDEKTDKDEEEVLRLRILQARRYQIRMTLKAAESLRNFRIQKGEL
jgi:hypothetical protein